MQEENFDELTRGVIPWADESQNSMRGRNEGITETSVNGG
jgi:hypothetical protein